MLKHINIRKELFWDVDQDRLDEEKNRRLIINRVLSLGTMEEFREMVKYYSPKEIHDTIRNIGYLDPKTLEFVVSYFGLKKEELTCCTKRRSQAKHWH